MRFAWLMAACLMAPVQADAIIGDDDFAVSINDFGVLVDTPTGPVRTVDGPQTVLEPGFAEWYGVAFTGTTGRLEGCGPGAAADWAKRAVVQSVGFESGPDEARAVGRLGDLEITTRFWFDDPGPYLIVAVILSNRGPETLRDILYTREWQSAEPEASGWTFPGDVPGVPEAPPWLMRQVWMLDDIPPGASKGLGFSYAPLGPVPVGGGVDVPLSLWTNVDFPAGVPVGATNGISYGDYDADGFIDMFACESANLWRNIGGTTWGFLIP